MTTPGPVKGIDVHECARLLEAGEAVLIDVREENEWNAERIPGATLYPLSTFLSHAPTPEPGKIGIFHCRSGRRTADHFDKFVAVGFTDTVHMEGGILDWKAQGYRTTS